MVEFQWHATGEKPALPNLPVRQVYCWVFGADNDVLLVSKDGNNWQLPGGTPEQDETPIDTLTREIQEETGQGINGVYTVPVFIGYYVVTKPGQPKFLQLRYKLMLNNKLADNSLMPNKNDDIKFAKPVPLKDIATYLPWAIDSGELSAATN